MDPDPQTQELVERVEALTGLNHRAAQVIALELGPGEHGPGDIVRVAEKLGYEFEPPADVKATPEPFAAEVTMDPATVLSEVYENSPRVLCEHMPKLGRAPEELQQLAPELVEQLPEDVLAMLVKVDLHEGKATFWLRDEANDVDRPIGPIDIRRFTDGQQLHEAFVTLMKRLDRVLAADFN
jgi:hypothetical protein